MIEFLLICVLVAQILMIIAIWATRQIDFSKEDKEVKEATEEIRQARQRLPRQN